MSLGSFMEYQAVINKKYFEGGCDAIIMLAQMFGASEEFIGEMMGEDLDKDEN